MDWMRHAAVGLLCAALAACGGGGGSPGATAGGSTSTPTQGTGGGATGGGGSTTTEPKVASFIYELSNSALSTSGADKALLTVTALDTNNNPVSGATVSVAVDSGVYTPASSTTDASGQASGNITIGGNKANRNITATISLSGNSKTAVIAVGGSQVTLTPVPANPTPGQQVRVDLKVTDANGTGVGGADVQLSGTLGLTGIHKTDGSGNVSAALGAAPSQAGSYTVIASALGVQTTRTLQVIAAGGGGIPSVTESISSASLSIVPNTIAPNTSGSTTNRAALTARFLTASNQAIQNVRVRFRIEAPGLGSGEAISTGSAVVYSDVNGEAIADYIAGTRSSPTNGVTIRACYGLNDAAVDACTTSVTRTLTVASQPISVTLGDNNKLSRGNNELTYIKQFDVAVADAAGNPVANAVISANVDIPGYYKGVFGELPVYYCENEDENRNGALDSGEDSNGNGAIEPRKADVIISFLNGNVTGTNGRLAIQVEYPQNVATWLKYQVRVSTSVSGSEGSVSRDYITDFIEGDDENGSFLTAPYGSGLCNQPN